MVVVGRVVGCGRPLKVFGQFGVPLEWGLQPARWLAASSDSVFAAALLSSAR